MIFFYLLIKKDIDLPLYLCVYVNRFYKPLKLSMLWLLIGFYCWGC